MLYFISDTHFGHKGVIKQCSRPFSSSEEMDEVLIEKWNRKVKRTDTVYILGDLIYKSERSPEWYLDRLSGKKILIKGNHDSAMLQKCGEGFFSEVADYKMTELSGHTVTLCHYPMLEWKNSRKFGSRKLGYLIHGHIHNRNFSLYDALFSQGNALNAGVDINGFEPISFDELIKNNESFKLSTMPDPVDKALFLCRSYHMHQCDKSGVAYAEHPIHIASKFDDDILKITALLHDTLEDTPLSPSLIGELFGERVLCAVETMTKRAGEDYFDYILRVKKDPVARAVKQEDLKHNMDLTRLRRITESDIERVKRYQRALDILR